ncbi:MAG: hypothetical protein LWX07_10435, partial [Bacteroidetes bacterium]|nr:hypothetical protein [Bacteroidota bacterium]
GFNTKQNTGTVSYSSVFDVADRDMSIFSPAPPVLVYPPENAVVDTNTEFVFNQGLSRVENRFYKINFFNVTGTPSKCLYYDVYIDRERFKVSELNNIGIENIIGCSFEWSVEVYENICLNDYIRDFYPNNKRYMTECVKRKVTIKQ